MGTLHSPFRQEVARQHIWLIHQTVIYYCLDYVKKAKLSPLSSIAKPHARSPKIAPNSRQ